MRTFWIVWAAASLGLAGAVSAQAVDAGDKTVVTALEMPADQFEMLLVPRTKQELEEIAAKWQRALQQSATQIAQARVVARRGGGAAAEARLKTLTAEQDQVARRLQSVLAELAAKGGEVDEPHAYLTSVTKSSALDNPMMFSTRLVQWATSPEGGVALGWKLLYFVATLLIARLAAQLTGQIVKRTLSSSRLKVTELLTSFFVHTSRNIVMGLGVVVGLSLMGVPVGPFLAAMGAVGFIVGFALQDTLGNFASGMMILFYRPYDLEDFVEVAGVTGKVEAMTLVSTTLLTPDNQLVVVPNKSIWGGIIRNVTGNATRRVDLKFGIGYDDDIRQAQQVLEKLLASHPLVLQEPAPVVRVHELADSSVNLICRPWVKTPDYWSVYWDLTRMVKETFDAEGISIPYPQQDVHMHQAPAAVKSDKRERSAA